MLEDPRVNSFVKYPEALRAYEQAIAVRQKDYPAVSLALFDNRLAAIYEAQGYYNKAIALGLRGLTKAKQDANNWWIADISTSLSHAYLKTNRPDSARYYGLQAFEAQQLRRQIAHDLHDEVGSTLSSISLLNGHTDKLLSENRPETAQCMVQKIYSDARQILESIDEIIWTINPGNDSLQRIIQRLQEYARPLMESKNIQFNFVITPDLDSIPISMEARRNLFLIGKESINNLVKYSGATHATVRFERQKNQLRVVIEDNGKGFDTNLATTRNGQQSISQRAKSIDGKLIVESAPGRGTSLQLYINL